MTRLALSVNGVERAVDVPAGSTLLDVLRDGSGWSAQSAAAGRVSAARAACWSKAGRPGPA